MAIKPIKKHKGYTVSSTGIVYGKSGQELSQYVGPNRYPRVAMYNKGRCKQYVHILVLETFVCEKPNGKEANHKNLIKTDNRVENLEWVTPKENINHAIINGAFPKDMNQGEKSGRTKLKNNEVWLIKKILNSKVVSREYIAKMFKTSKVNVIDEIGKGRNWKCVKYP